MLQNTKRVLMISSGAFSEAQHFVLSESEENRLCSQLMEGVEEKLNLTCENFTSVEAARTDADIYWR